MKIFFHDKEQWQGKIKHQGLLKLIQDSSELTEMTTCIVDLEPTAERVKTYWKREGLVILGIINSSLVNLASIYGKPNCQLIGINQIPFFLNKPAVECTSLEYSHRNLVADLFSTYEIPILWSQDTPGMVSARVVSMIINEACFLVGEGTSNEEDLNTAMKLGVNYPGGPMEWLAEIGAIQIADILTALYTYYQSEKYRLAPYLHRQYLEQKMLILN